ncbi:fibrobacter succinogenes major paralogous domain-containing protein [Alteromonas macleodii]|uniref:fibrobacter succinogenes major paralogous domain-containing protein n=1 Tax=Alteromonas macleodii TaxID=28108 RepID=UPI0036F492ED
MMTSSPSAPASMNTSNLEFDGSQNTFQDVEGNRYKTVKIGKLEWFAENLRATQFQDGSPVDSGFIPKDDEKNLLKYGRLYHWQDVNDERKLCPYGWRIATDADWQEMERAIGVAQSELAKVNQFQFGATAAGVKIGNWYITQGMYTEFWTSTSATDKEAYARTLAYSWWNSHKGEIRRAKLNKDYMFSVRCVRDTK